MSKDVSKNRLPFWLCTAWTQVNFAHMCLPNFQNTSNYKPFDALNKVGYWISLIFRCHSSKFMQPNKVISISTTNQAGTWSQLQDKEWRPSLKEGGVKGNEGRLCFMSSLCLIFFNRKEEYKYQNHNYYVTCKLFLIIGPGFPKKKGTIHEEVWVRQSWKECWEGT